MSIVFQINPPSLPAVLDTLNLINGIVFLHIRYDKFYFLTLNSKKLIGCIF